MLNSFQQYKTGNYDMKTLAHRNRRNQEFFTFFIGFFIAFSSGWTKMDHYRA
jgi:hypothetical protein